MWVECSFTNGNNGHDMFSEVVHILSTKHHNTAEPAAAQLHNKYPFIQHQTEEQFNNCFLLAKSPPHCWCWRNLRLYVVLLCSLLGMEIRISALLSAIALWAKPWCQPRHIVCKHVMWDQSQYANKQLNLGLVCFQLFYSLQVVPELSCG